MVRQIWMATAVVLLVECQLKRTTPTRLPGTPVETLQHLAMSQCVGARRHLRHGSSRECSAVDKLISAILVAFGKA